MGDFFAFDGGQKWKVCDLSTITAPAGNNAKGAYSSLANPLTVTASGIYVYPILTGTGNRYALIDIAVDPASGPLIDNLYISQANIVAANSSFYFPLRVAAGSSIYARYQMSGSGSVVKLRTMLCPSSLFSSAFNDCDTYGVSTATSKGTIVTPGASFTKGSYVALTTNVLSDLKALMFAAGHDSFSITSGASMMVDVATGINTPTTVIINNFAIHTSGSQDSFQIKNLGPFMTPIPQGNGIWVRAASDIASPETFTMAVYGLR